ncbi:MAG TPA: YqaA family protein [Patescibacteria group bacterium]|nr:YqaA family protein [Patescibacteria group bacterium]
MKPLRKLYDFMLRLSGSRHATPALAAVSFIESSVFPIPPDVMLIPMCIARRDRAFYYAAVCTVASVVGGLLGYAIGYFLFETLGQRILDFYHITGKFTEMQAKYNDYGGWIIFAKGLTPFPYKILTILSGVMHMALPVFIVSSVACRALRFFLVAGLLWKFGAPIQLFIEKYLGWVTLAFLLVLIGGFVAIAYI